MGNPISATGVRNVTHLVHHLRSELVLTHERTYTHTRTHTHTHTQTQTQTYRKNKMKLGLVATSVLGGQGMSMLIEAF